MPLRSFGEYADKFYIDVPIGNDGHHFYHFLDDDISEPLQLFTALKTYIEDKGKKSHG